MNRSFRRAARPLGAAVFLTAVAVGFGSVTALAKRSARRGSATGVTALAMAAPRGFFTATQDPFTACTLPDGSTVDFLHCYTPQDIRTAYGVNSVAPLASGKRNYGQGQTIVLVDSYGSPTAANDLKVFHDTFFKGLPNPNFQQVFPQGNPQYNNTCHSAGLSGPCSAANWSGEATLDIEWAYSIAPKAHIILLAVPPAETLGVQGFPNLFKAISGEIAATPPGTLFSMSFGVAEPTFGGAGAIQTARFDRVFKQGLAKNDNFFSSTGDFGSADFSKQHKEANLYPYPVVGWPASSPYVVAVGGTQLQYGWTWDPLTNDASNAPAYFNWTPGGDTQPVWNESWTTPFPIGTGGGSSIIYSRPSWQSGVDPQYGNHRLIPDTAWNAAVNGGVDVYITAYPQFNCGNTTGCWTFFGGTSAASPQTAGLAALANAARKSQGKSPIGFLDPILYGGVGSSSYNDVVPKHYGSAPATFTGSDVVAEGTTSPVQKSVGDLVDNQLWELSIPGYPTTPGYDPTTGWGTPNAPAFVAALAGMP